VKQAIRIIAITTVLIGAQAIFAQQTPNPAPAVMADPDAPSLTLDERISLVTDDLKRQDALEKANAAFQKTIAPINEHQEATKKVIEAEHPGWTLQTGPQGWSLVKKPEAPAKSPMPPAPSK